MIFPSAGAWKHIRGTVGMVPVWLFVVRPVFGAILKPSILTKRTDTTC
jgi:hypothetical protein